MIIEKLGIAWLKGVSPGYPQPTPVLSHGDLLSVSNYLEGEGCRAAQWKILSPSTLSLLPFQINLSANDNQYFHM